MLVSTRKHSIRMSNENWTHLMYLYPWIIIQLIIGIHYILNLIYMRLQTLMKSVQT